MLVPPTPAKTLVDEGDRDRALADRRRDALDVAAAHVADGEHAGQAGFEQVRGARQTASRAAARSSGERSGPVLMKPFASSATQPSSQPVLANRAGHDEDVTGCRASRARLTQLSRQRHALESGRRLRGRRSRCGCAARSPDCPRCGGSGSATSLSASPADADQHVHAPAPSAARNTAACPAELPPPTTMTSFARAELRLHRAWRRSRRPRLRTARGSRSGGFRYSAPVAMITARAGTRRPSSISNAYGRRSQESCCARLSRSSDLRAELLRLRVGAAGELLRRRCRSETRGSSRSSSSSPPGRRARWTRAPGRRALPRRRRPPPPAPPGRRRRSRGRARCVWSIASLNPRQSAICWLVGLRSTTSPRQISTGTSSTPTWNRSSSSWTPASRSRSM